MDTLKIVFTTCANENEAEKIARAILEADLGACVNIIQNVRSFYRWKGKIEDEGEVILFIKTRKGKLNDLRFAIEGLHNYDVPPFEVLNVEGASSEFHKWILQETP